MTNIKYPAAAIHQGGPIIPVCAFQTQGGGRLRLKKRKKSSWHREHVYTGTVSGANVP